MPKRIEEDVHDITYVTLWLQLCEDPVGGYTAIADVVSTAYAAVGLSVCSVLVFDVSADKCVKLARVPVPSLSVIKECEQIPHPTSVLFEARRRGAETPILDYLGCSEFRGTNSSHTYRHRAPLISISIRAALFEKYGEKLKACVFATLEPIRKPV